MKKDFLGIILVAFLAFTGCKKESSSEKPPASAPPAPERTASATPPFQGGRQTSFQEVTAQLDPGGSLFLYVAADQWLRGLSTNISDFRDILLSLPGAAGGKPDDINGVFDALTHLVQSSGIEDITGIGMSGVPVAPQLYRTRFILHHPGNAGQGFLWSLFGRAPHPLGGQAMLPSNTAFAAFGDLDVAQLWQVLERELSQSGIAPVVEAARAWPQLFEQRTRIPWAPLLESLGGELGIVLTLDDVQTVALPGGGGGARIEIPAPALLVAVKTKSDLLYDRLAALLKANPKTTVTEEAGLKICSMPLPLPLPIQFEPTVASSGDYFYFATSSELVRTVQEVRQGKQPGLKSSAEFQSLAKHLPAEGNQFVYAGRRVTETLADLQRQALRGSGMAPEQLAVIQRLFGADNPTHSLSVSAHTTTGWHSTSVGNKDSASAVLLAPTIGVSAVVAGMVLPALAKAKAQAQTINSVNNLKQLGLAARIYANENKDKFPNAETWCDDLKDLVGSAKVYKAANDTGPGACSFAFNAKLSGMQESRINPQTVLFFETESGWNQHGGRELLLREPRSRGVYVIGFADGSVQQVQPARLETLRWDP